MLNCLKATNSTFTLIHDVWTTKGNGFGFIGSSASFIDNDWNYVVQNLSLKLFAWYHKRSFLAEPIFNSLAKDGLQRKMKLGLEAPRPLKLKKDFLGSFPYSNKLKPIPEEDEDFVDEEDQIVNLILMMSTNRRRMAEEDYDDDTGKKQEKYGHDSNIFTNKTFRKKKTSSKNRIDSNKLHELTQNVFGLFCQNYQLTGLSMRCQCSRS
ncbi:hypothetical protein VP01_469g1 [Puccinia sorghi]|uniref:Uncharacterized protein n=1 Tax=Puccinia sorghi TaxID=27349 RepID=A0A0L6UNV1_9BASI|nr:hypothetical protein VP01_469g1 [Puccinia sorghi]